MKREVLNKADRICTYLYIHGFLSEKERDNVRRRINKAAKKDGYTVSEGE